MTEEKPVAGREIADLLPFYATGRLDGEDRQRVMRALMSDAELRRELSLILEERSAAIEDNEALAAPSRQAAAKFFAALDAAPARGKARFDLAGWLAARLESLAPRPLAWGAMAAALVVAAQAGLIGTLIAGRHGTQAAFESASINPGAGIRSGGSLIVSFVPNATAQEINKLLEDNTASIVAGPLPGGLYELRLGDRALTKAEVDELIVRLKERRNLIRFVAPGAPPD
ncbi:MAG: hypothetical protein ABSA13_02410 [Beijerinckiaceae bacterium]|jgi:hypothetical protein